MEREFNLIDEPWICVRTSNCKVCEVSLMDIFCDAHKYEDFAGELKTQDIAILRLLLAVVHTVFSRYDYDGNEISGMSNDQAVENWERLWNNGSFPIKPFERYFEKWHDRFWLFDDNYPFYQSKGEIEKHNLYSTAKMIGSIVQSNNKSRLFSERTESGRKLSYGEATRWLINLIGFDDIASKKPTPKKTWLCELGLIVAKGKNLFETIMLNYISKKCSASSTPSWEKEILTTGENKEIFFENVNDIPTAELFTVRSRYILLHRENGYVDGYRVSGGEYFSHDNMFSEPMTLWEKKDKKDSLSPMIPKRHSASKSTWREFGAIATLSYMDKETDSYKKVHISGVVQWLSELFEDEILDEDYMVSLCTADVGYNFSQSTSLPINDVFSDSLTFHSGLLLKVGAVFRSRINDEIEKCDKAAKAVGILSIDLQKANGATEGKSGPKLSGDEAKRQFYERIDKPFRLWLRELNPNKYMEINSYIAKLEVQLKKAALDIADNLLDSMNISSVIGKMVKKDNKTEIYSASKKLNEFNGIISNIFDKAGGEKNGK